MRDIQAEATELLRAFYAAGNRDGPGARGRGRGGGDGEREDYDVDEEVSVELLLARLE